LSDCVGVKKVNVDATDDWTRFNQFPEPGFEGVSIAGERSTQILGKLACHPYGFALYFPVEHSGSDSSVEVTEQ
jgi:hypothetical protein